MRALSPLETHFEPFRRSIHGRRTTIDTPYGQVSKLYADTTAKGQPDTVVEQRILELKTHLANTHSHSNTTGDLSTRRYHFAGHIIKEHVNAGDNDVLITGGSGMTDVVNKLVRMMGLHVPEHLRDQVVIPDEQRPVVFVTHMEHHSNILPWKESIAQLVMLPPTENGLPDVHELEKLCAKYSPRPIIGSFIAASNVTGIRTPYHEMSRVIHEHKGICVVDFAASAPYDAINMHPSDGDGMERLDVVMFSPHKFQGGVEGPGVMVMDKHLIKNQTPDRPGGGTVLAVDAHGRPSYVPSIEAREDGGTPPVVGRMRAALAIRVKELMGMDKIEQREAELVARFMDGLQQISSLHVFEEHNRDRLGIVSFYMDNVPHGLLTKLLNDRFGIQVRNGCSCAGPYGHVLLDIDDAESDRLIRQIVDGDESNKPGWVRVSLHPTMLDSEVDEILYALREIDENIADWRQDYRQVQASAEFVNILGGEAESSVEQDFALEYA